MGEEKFSFFFLITFLFTYSFIFYFFFIFNYLKVPPVIPFPLFPSSFLGTISIVKIVVPHRFPYSASSRAEAPQITMRQGMRPFLAAAAQGFAASASPVARRSVVRPRGGIVGRRC